MGDFLSTPASSPDPIPPQNSVPPPTTTSEITTTQESTPLSETLETPTSKESENPIQETQKDPETRQDQEGVDEEGEEEEEGECGFCLFMKAGECKDVFIEWEKCVQEADESREDIVDKCYKATTALKECMEAHPDHYGPILKAEKMAQKRAMDELEAEKEAFIDVENQKQGEGAKESVSSGDKQS